MHGRLSCIDYRLSQTDPARFAADLHAAISHDGFMLLANHPLHGSLRDDSFAFARAFFSLPRATKARIHISQSVNHRGYFGLRQENLDQQYHDGDYKEGIKIGRELAPDHPLVRAGIPLHGANQWLDESTIPGFRQQMQRLFDACVVISRRLMQAIAVALELPVDYFAGMINQPMATLVPIHYPGTAGCANPPLGAAAHSDFGCLTLVLQDGVPGLEICNAQQQWRAVPADPELLTVNIGDMLQYWSGNMYPSTCHRVAHREDRHTFAFFFDPNYDARLVPIVDAANDARHTITALDYLQQRIGDSFSYFQQTRSS